MNAVGVVGGDFGEAEWDVFRRHAINTDDVEIVADGKTFFWSGRYDYDMNTAHTLDTQLNVFETFDPKLSENSKNAELLFLANILPTLQKQVREQCPNAEFVAMDTMNYWIIIDEGRSDRDDQGRRLHHHQRRRSTAVDRRAQHPQGRTSIMDLGLKAVVIKRGEYGATLFTRDGYFAVPAYPLRKRFRPDGCGRYVRGRVYGLSRRAATRSRTTCFAVRWSTAR